MSVVGDQLRDAFTPWTNADLQTYADAIGVMFEPVATIAHDQGADGDDAFLPGWGVLFDVDLCPAAYLPYLGQFVGVTVPVGTGEAAARAMIRDERGMRRGTADAIIAATTRNLTGAQFVQLLERTTLAGTVDAYQFVVVVHTSEVTDMAQLEADVAAVKPGGVLANFVSSAGFPWVSATHTWAGEPAGVSWADTATVHP